MIDDEKDRNTYTNLAERVSTKQEREERADRLALSLGVDIAVVKCGVDDFQLWPVSRCNGEMLYVARGTKE